MASYLLLRSNNQTGPHNLEDLVKIGLKPYDLVWVQGKSAAWRYPSEVEELKPYAPAIEEQPYDRFYKKETQKQVKEEPVQEQSYQPTVMEEKPVVEEKYAKYIPKKSVFVTLPGQRTAVAMQKPVVTEPKPVAEPTITVTENPDAAQIKYSQPLDEIKEMYVKTLQERKTKLARKSFVVSSLKKAAIIAGLILSGVLAGYFIKSDKKSGLTSQLVQQPVKAEPALTGPATKDPVIDKPVTENNHANTNPGVTSRQNTAVVNQPTTNAVAPENTPMPPAMKERLLQQEKRQYAQNRLKQTPPVVTIPETKEVISEPVVKNIANNPVTGERTRQVRDGSVGNPNTTFSNPAPNANDTRPISRGRKSGLESLVAVTSNDYKRVAFGGIRNLELTVTNDSRFILDKVTVELEYLKPNELPFRTEMIQFHTISPKGSSTIKIPDTNRGIKVLYKIIDIQSMQSETASSF